MIIHEEYYLIIKFILLLLALKKYLFLIKLSKINLLQFILIKLEELIEDLLH